MIDLDRNIDRTECPYRYLYQFGNNKIVACCLFQKRLTGHNVSCISAVGFKCPWELNEKINRLEKCVLSLMEEKANE